MFKTINRRKCKKISSVKTKYLIDLKCTVMKRTIVDYISKELTS